MRRAPLFGRVRSSTVRLSSTLECVPELLNLLWGQLLAPAHNAQHLFALDLALPFASRLRFHALAIGLGVEEPRQEFEARIGDGGVARGNRRDDQKVLQGAAPAFPAARTKIAPRNRFNGATSCPAVMGARMPGAIPSRSAPPGSVIAAYPNGAGARARMNPLPALEEPKSWVCDVDVRDQEGRHGTHLCRVPSGTAHGLVAPATATASAPAARPSPPTPTAVPAPPAMTAAAPAATTPPSATTPPPTMTAPPTMASASPVSTSSVPATLAGIIRLDAVEVGREEVS